VFGCDVCQEVCPWNAQPPASSDPAWQPRPAWDMRSTSELAEMSDDELRRAMRGSAMSRAKVSGLRRNIAGALSRGGPPETALE
jgi:epoxyqueuosine reductase